MNDIERSTSMPRRGFICAAAATIVSAGLPSVSWAEGAAPRVLVTYFSATGTTRSAAKRIADALGDGIKRVSDDELAKRKKFRRTIATARALKAGDEIRYEDILFKRPGTGIPADKYKDIIGRHVSRDIDENKTLFWEDLVK